MDVVPFSDGLSEGTVFLFLTGTHQQGRQENDLGTLGQSIFRVQYGSLVK